MKYYMVNRNDVNKNRHNLLIEPEAESPAANG